MRAPRGFIDESDPKVCQIGHPAPAWLVNYADLMTELVCFFVILYALSAALNKDVQKASKDVKEMMEKGEIKGEVKIDKEGLKISIEEQGAAGFFASGDAEPTAEMDATLAKLVPNLRKLTENHELLVEGHTDDQPIHNAYFDSNWELSTARSTSVTRLLIEKYGIPKSHIGAVGYGDTRPVAPNDTPDNRAKNRHVVFFIKSASLAKKGLGAPGAAVPAVAAAVVPTRAAPQAERPGE
ncbi:MAG: flagellar motor protein MotB [Elusimicrobiota bacterium]